QPGRDEPCHEIVPAARTGCNDDADRPLGPLLGVKSAESARSTAPVREARTACQISLSWSPFFIESGNGSSSGRALVHAACGLIFPEVFRNTRFMTNGHVPRAALSDREASILRSFSGATMDLGNQRESSNVEDRRGMGMAGGGLGVGGVVVALVA